MIKIAFVIDTIDSPTGGTEKQLLLLLGNLDRTRFAPVLCVLHTSDWLENNFALCPLHVMNVRSFREPLTLFRFLKFAAFLRAERIDVVHSFFKDGMRLGIAAAKLAGVRFVIAVRRNQGYWMTALDLKVTKCMNRWVDLIIANADHTKAWTTQVEGVPPGTIAVIHNGIELQPFDRDQHGFRDRYRGELDIPPNSPVVGIVANLRPVKALDVFIRAASLAKKSLPAAHFIIVGEGELEEGLKELAKGLELDRCVHFLGRRHDIPRILATLDLGVLSSDSESFSNTIVEYLASGLPVVCTDVGGAREAVENGVNGFVVAAGDYQALSGKIVEILTGENLKEMGAASRTKAQELFSLAAMMNKYEKIYTNAVLPQ
jgi:L-malate glycosyltransferase